MTGIELLDIIDKNKLEENTVVTDNFGNTYVYRKGELGELKLYARDILFPDKYYVPEYSRFTSKDTSFVILEKKEISDIDIDKIETLGVPITRMDNPNYYLMLHQEKINELIKAVKQINKNIGE